MNSFFDKVKEILASEIITGANCDICGICKDSKSNPNKYPIVALIHIAEINNNAFIFYIDVVS
ncbi:hypothetical protein [Myroides injenensis]|uniref:hypothetical protein n=1 Tax=Myroides injenensis TaxID=1183151 RepID=UPI00028A2156|nr:hypothetical protein [Myroides injenensis]